MNNYRLFYNLLANHLLANITNMFVWFAITFWVFLQTHSVLATSWIAGIFAVASMLGGIVFGPIVDHERKKTAVVHSSIISLVFYALGAFVFFTSDVTTFNNPKEPLLWTFIIIMMLGTVAGNLRTIALSTSVTMLFDENRDKVNGLVGATQGITFAVTSVLSGLVIGFFGIGVAIMGALVSTVIVLLHMYTVTIHEEKIVHLEKPKHFDFKRTFAMILLVPGLFGLIIFNTFNNFLGGVFMALMDAYGLSMVSVQTWGTLWGVFSLAMIAGSVYVTKYGVGVTPLRRIMILNLIMWGMSIIFPLQASIVLLSIAMIIWLALSPIVEAAEQTVLQNVVPFENQGRVFGFAQSIESAASPITTFLIGPLAQFVFIPFMTTGVGVTLIGVWFGTGPARGIALVFIIAAILGVIATLFAWNSKSFTELSNHHTDV